MRFRLGGNRGAAGQHGGTGQHVATGQYAASGSGGLASGLQDTGATVLVLIDRRVPGDRARLVELSRVGPGAGVYCVWLAQRAEHLPAACTAYLDVRGDRTVSVGDSMTGTSTAGIAGDAVDAAAAIGFSRATAPLIDAGAVIADESDLPRSVSWLDLNDPRIADDPAAVVERWQESRSIVTGPAAPPPGPRRPGTLRALVGAAADGPHTLDLRSHGPHALVGGTTGAGKSELLQTWILAMAAAYSPQRVTFLLVDYKGGSAFRECVNLPHTVGLVTDLSPHLVRRALVSLGAELTYREHLFAEKRVKDLQELEKTGDPATPPSLVIVVDEFAALVRDVPEFVDGMVNVAQRGRSLGLHLVLATQRPSGVIKDNLRANTNLRLALRMADEGDSADVLGSSEAAYFDPALPGRAVSKTGPGRLVPFQAGYVGGWTSASQREPDVAIEELVIGEGRTWPAAERAASGVVEHGPTDIMRITATIRRASELAGLPVPRRPWLDELARVYDLARLPTRRRDDELVFGVVDEPGQQRQSVVAFYPDTDGNLAIFGTGGAGKSTALRSLAVAAAVTVRGGPCQVFCLDFSSRGLDMLADLPHVGAVIHADEGDRVRRLLRTLMAMLDDRARRYSQVRAGSITEYRGLAGEPDEPRVLVFLDGFAAFRQQFEMADGGKWFDAFNTLAAEGRPLGIHVILAADRPAALPPRLASRIQRRLTMRLADDAEYVLAGGEPGVITPESPSGRALLGRAEVQVAVFGGSTGHHGPVARHRPARRVDAPPAGNERATGGATPGACPAERLARHRGRPPRDRARGRRSRPGRVPPGRRLPHLRAAVKRPVHGRGHDDHRARPRHAWHDAGLLRCQALAADQPGHLAAGCHGPSGDRRTRGQAGPGQPRPRDRAAVRRRHRADHRVPRQSRRRAAGRDDQDPGRQRARRHRRGRDFGARRGMAVAQRGQVRQDRPGAPAGAVRRTVRLQDRVPEIAAQRVPGRPWPPRRGRPGPARPDRDTRMTLRTPSPANRKPDNRVTRK